MSEELALLPEYLAGHLQLSLLALAICTGLGIPLGVAATRVPWLERVVLGAAALVQTIPSLALLAAMVPVLAALSLPSIGFLPAIVALTLYGALPVLRNTVTGVRAVPAALCEAARGVGMTDRQMLVRVELPLAAPVIVAGVRTATVWIVGIATLSTPVGSPSLGNFIFSGLQTRNFTAVGVGCVAAAGLALALDGIVRLAEGGVRAGRRVRLAASAVLLGALAASAIAPAAGAGPAGGRDRPVVIGAKTFTESYILAEILAATVEHEAHLPVRVAQSLGSTVAFDALRAGDIDAYVDYSGTIWATVLGKTGRPPDRRTVLATVTRELRRRHRIAVAASLGFENAYALAMRTRDAEREGIRRISELARIAPGLSIGADYEFLSRPEWHALEDTYGLRFGTKRSMDPALMYQAAGQGTVDVISAFSTDGRIESFHLRVLEDDRGAIPPYDAIVLAGPRLPAAARAALRKLDGTVDAAVMRRMNADVDDRGLRPREVARRFLSRRAARAPGEPR